MKKYSWSFCEDDGCWCNGSFCTIEECITSAREQKSLTNGNYEKVLIGENVPFVPAADGTAVLNEIWADVIGAVGTVGVNRVNYDLEQKEQLQELDNKLSEVVREWLKKYGYYPDFWTIENIEEYSLISATL